MPEPLFCSLNEIQTMATKAARGAGLPWGVADEAGRAVRWLEARGLAGVSALDGALDGLSASDWQHGFPVPDGAAWRARSGEIDGLLAGMAIADRADRQSPFVGDDALVLANVRWPLLLLPFLAGVAQAHGMQLSVSAGPQALPIRIGPHRVDESCRAIEETALAEAVRVERASDDARAPGLSHLDGSIPIDKEVYARLNRRAAKTYVPESAQSQARGAGGSDLIETD